jgi:hypothetical protein
MPIKGMDNVKKAIDKTKTQANMDIKGVYFSGLRTIIKATPVDEGRARNNWFLTEGMPSKSSGGAEDKSASGSLSRLTAMPKDIFNKKIYFTNNLPYIETLEYGGYPNPSGGDKTIAGYSKQLTPFKSPKGWVRATLVSMANKVRKL